MILIFISVDHHFLYLSSKSSSQISVPASKKKSQKRWLWIKMYASPPEMQLLLELVFWKSGNQSRFPKGNKFDLIKPSDKHQRGNRRHQRGIFQRQQWDISLGNRDKQSAKQTKRFFIFLEYKQIAIAPYLKAHIKVVLQ